ncbi:MAG TPA: hypothetical protein VKA84_16070 [Gemmatimonadaceae bacterium]|nr:hypothetical protein [Gemmatimonadaceae bacterium]
MHDGSLFTRTQRGLLTAALLLTASASTARAQLTVACDFDIADNLGRNTSEKTIRLIGRPGRGTNSGSFYIINGNTPESDVDKDGYAPAGCNYSNIYIERITPLVNLADDALAIPQRGVVVSNLPRVLLSGETGEVSVFVDVPAGTPAGRYLGSIEIRDLTIVAVRNATNEPLNTDVILVQVEVVPERSFSIVDPDVADTLDSLVIRSRSGQRGSGVVRVANLGNIGLSNVRLTATDLRSESAVGLVIPADRIAITPGQFSSLARGDTARVTVTVDVPRGLLGGRYRGALIVQGEDAGRQEIPLIVIVTSSRGILFANNPVRSVTGDLAQVAFNGDPGTGWRLIIFDMDGMVVYKQDGTVFAGQVPGTNTPGTVDNPQPGADFAVNVTWPLINGRGENVASGVYLVVVESFVTDARGVRQRQQARDRLMVIR